MRRSFAMPGLATIVTLGVLALAGSTTLLCVVKDQRRGAGTPVMGHVGHALIRPVRSDAGGGDGAAGRSEDDSRWGVSGQSWASPVTVTRWWLPVLR